MSNELSFEVLYKRTLQLLGTAILVINDYERGLGFDDDQLTDVTSLIVIHDSEDLKDETED